MTFRHAFAAFLLATSAVGAVEAAPTPKEQLLTPPADATHFAVVSSAGKHGDEYMWTTPDGRLALRQSILLRGLIFETDETIRFGTDGMPAELTVRGVTPSGDAAETFNIAAGDASWASPVDKGHEHYSSPAFYLAQGGPFAGTAPQVDRLLAAGRAGMALLPSGRANLEKIAELEIDGADGKKRVALQLLRGTSQTPQPIWTEGNRFFGAIQGLGLLPVGYEQNLDAMQQAQDAAIAGLAPAIARKFLTAEARMPVLFDHVRIYDAEKERFIEDQAVLASGGKIVSIVPGGSLAPPPNTRGIDGRGKTLVPGLWDSHMHMSDDFAAVSELALGVTSCRNPGGSIELAVSQRKRRAEGTLLSPECFSSAIVDQKGPLAAQGSLVVGSLEETLAAVRRIKDAGLHGVKFYTSMKPEWIPPAAKLAHELGLHVHGHIPAGMRTLDAINAGYDEITHIYFATMNSMPDYVVEKSNTTLRMTGPGRHFKDVDLNGPVIKQVIDTMIAKKAVIDPTLVVVEGVLLAEAGTVSPAYVPYLGTLPTATERNFRSGGLPLPEGMTRDDGRASVQKMREYVTKMRRAGVPIVAGTDGYGMEIVRELEMYVEGGMTPAEALATATIDAASNVGIADRTGSITVGKEADLLLVDGDPSKRIGDLRHVDQVMSDGVLMDGDALRKEAGFNGKPK